MMSLADSNPSVRSFATGWNYFFKYVIVLPNNLTVTGILIAYWRPDLNVSIWIVVFGVAIIALNV
jgi:yeast amino acid transporter